MQSYHKILQAVSNFQFSQKQRKQQNREIILTAPATLTSLDKVTPDIDFTDKPVVQYDFPVARILLQIMMIKLTANKF